MKTFIKYILAIILAIAIIAYFFVNLVSSTILNKKYILSKLDENDYYNKIYEQVKSNFENYIYQSGLEESSLEDIVSKEKVKKDTQIIINNLYVGLNEEIDTTEIRENLNNKIKETIGNQNISNTQQESINTLIDHICNEYKNTMSHFSFEEKVNEKYVQVMKYINLAKKILLITIGIDFLLLLVLNLKRVYKFISLIGLTGTITGLTLLIVNYFINSKIKIQTITILNDTISEIIRKILNEITTTIYKYGLVFTIIGILLIICINAIHNYKKYGKAKMEETYEEE